MNSSSVLDMHTLFGFERYSEHPCLMIILNNVKAFVSMCHVLTTSFKWIKSEAKDLGVGYFEEGF